MADRVPALFWACWLLQRSLSIALVGGVAILAACSPSFQQMTAAEYQGIATDTAYAECERRPSQKLAEERLDYIVLAPINVDLRRHNVGAGEHVSRALGPIDRHNGYLQSPYA